MIVREDKKAVLEAVVNGYYKLKMPDKVLEAIAYAVEQNEISTRPTLLVCFIRLAEVYPDVRAYLSLKDDAYSDALKYTLEQVLSPPKELMGAGYLPEHPENPEEMDLCWGEFFATGQVEFAARIVGVLDWKDLCRTQLDALGAGHESALQLRDEQLLQLQETGILFGGTEQRTEPHVAMTGDVDLLLWRGIQEKNEACVAILRQLSPEQVLYVATKGSALWSLQANALVHERIRDLCDEEAVKPGGAGRRWLVSG